MLTRLFFCISIFLVPLSSSYAQISYPSNSADQIKARIADLNPPDKGLPDNEFNLVDERRLVDQEISQLRSSTQQSIDSSKLVELIARAKATVSKAFQDISAVDCTKLTDARFSLHYSIRDSMSQVQQVLRGMLNTEYEPDPFLNAPWNDSRFTDAAYCANWKKFVGDGQNQSRMLEYFDKVKSKVTDNAKVASETKTNASVLLDLLQKRKDAIEKKQVAQSTKTELSDKLWIIIGLIGFFSISAILAVKLFSETIQVEWVASGQVIQFVTVMILLSVIMALGLAGILKENTLGTLLGGIGGYVLAQGVGRAAAREVSRGAQPSKP
ncbi:MAG: hypothetical protein KF751_07670 [Nitrospira sp.]|nr:hypothetical protein [Nitrospira sp.]